MATTGKARPVNGKDLMLFIDGKAIALAKTFSLTLNAETLDTSSKDDGIWEESELVQARNYDISADAVYSADANREAVDLTYEALFGKFVAGEAVPFVFGIPSNVTDTFPQTGWKAPTNGGYSGKMLITSLALNGNKGEAASLTLNGRGVGALTKQAGA